MMSKWPECKSDSKEPLLPPTTPSPIMQNGGVGNEKGSRGWLIQTGIEVVDTILKRDASKI